jgi:hypothetical protein
MVRLNKQAGQAWGPCGTAEQVEIASLKYID